MAEVQIDRIEEKLAVLVHRGTPFELPRELLPEGAKEGDTLDLTLTVNAETTRQARDAMTRKRARLSADDDGGDFSL